MRIVKRASIDIGSNTVLLLIGEVIDGKVQEIKTGERVSSLGKDLDQTKKFDPESMQDTFDALVDYRRIIEREGLVPAQTLVTATEAARKASNAKKFFREVEEKLGFRVHVITEEGEGYYTYRGIVQKNHQNMSVIMDMGGASTELIKVSDGVLEGTISLPLGSVRGSGWMMESVFDVRVRSILEGEVSRMAFFKSSRLTGVGGTMTSLAAIFKNMKSFDRDKIEGCTIDCRDLKKCIEDIQYLSEDELNKKFPFLGKRVKSIRAGGRLAKIVGDFLGGEVWEISTYGLRHGTILESCIDKRFIAI